MQWYKRKNFNYEKIAKLSKTLNVPDAISSLLLQRGIADFESAKLFFRPDWSQLHDPFLMKDMNKAVDRILLAINANEKIMIFGDYDVDGTTSVALLTDYLKNKIFYIKPYIPDRYSEGYGISKKGIEVAKEEGISLIIALDCGIKAFQEIHYAKELGIDFIVCDHHLPEKSIPNAVAVLDPKRYDCKYPFKELCGCGIGFKLIQALQTKVDQLETLLDSDQVELLDIIRRLDSDMIAIEHLKRNADSDAQRIRDLVSTLDSDGRLLEKVLQNEYDISQLRLDLDSESAEIRAVRADIDSENLDLSEGYTRDRITIIRQRLSRLEDSDYFDSDRIVRTINLNRIGGADLDSDSLYTSITKETDSHVARIRALEKLLGVGAFTINAPAPVVTSDSDIISIEYVQTGATISQDTTFKWYISGLGGGEIVSEEFTVSENTAFESVIRFIIYSVNNNSLAMNYIDKMYIDLDSGLATDDAIHFRFKDNFTDMQFKAEVVETFDGGSFIIKRV